MTLFGINSNVSFEEAFQLAYESLLIICISSRNKKEVYRNITLFNHWIEKNMRDKSSIIINNKIKLSNRFRCYGAVS